ncbi:MAG: hypothetical protein ABMB14_29220 [Myxococcota bacterium]
MRSAVEPPTTARRTGNVARPTTAVCATSAIGASTAAHRVARPTSASSDRADNVTSSIGRATAADAAGAGGASSTTCALVPDSPKLDTPPIRAGPAHGTAAVFTARVDPRVIRGLSDFRWRCGGISPFAAHNATFSSPATPAAVSRWPKFVLTEPRCTGRTTSANTAFSASTSIGSPSGVPVPWASTYPTSDGSTPAFRSAARITACWAAPFGAVSPLLRPSWFTAVPRITATIRSPSASASASRFSTTRPAPSPRPYPSADASNVLHRPSGDSAPSFEKYTVGSGAHSRFAPPASPTSISPRRSASTARWTDTSDELHAVSTVIAGPVNPSV